MVVHDCILHDLIQCVWLKGSLLCLGIPPEFLDDEFLGNNVDGSFPTEGPCHYFGLRKVAAGENKKTNQPKIVCKPHR